MNLLEYLKQYADVLCDEPLAKHTTFRIGGTCDYFVYPKTMLSFMRTMQLLKEQGGSFSDFGKGSNLLCSDDLSRCCGLPGPLSEQFYFEEDGTLVAEAGCSIILLAQEAIKAIRSVGLNLPAAFRERWEVRSI